MGDVRYVALIRGINVGGRNKVAMADLRAALEEAGFDDVRTYIQSGNVLFRSGAPRASLEATIEAALERRFGVPLVVVVRSHAQLRSIVAKAPEGFGGPDHHCDVIFLRAPLTPRAAMAVVREREGVDRSWTGTGVLYVARLSARRTQSKMSSIVGTPAYAQMTIRSWATTTKLLALLDG
jgi:uncharacterized protein (DUF1697 family)